MLKARKSSEIKRDPHKDKKLYDTKKLKKVGQGKALVSTAQKEKTVFRKVKQEKDLKLTEIKKLYMQLKSKQKEKTLSPLQKNNLVSKLLEIAKPNLKKIQFKRLGSRVLTGCLKYGKAATRQQLLKLLQQDFISLSFGKHSSSLAKQMARTTNHEFRSKFASLVKQNLVKMLRSPESAEVAEVVFESQNIATQTSIVSSFYGNEYAAFVATKGLSLKEFLLQHEENIQDQLEPRISKLIDKALITLTLVQQIVYSFIQASEVSIHLRLMSESNLQLSYTGLLSSRIGTKVACYFYTIADAKQRKHFVKELKEEVVDYSKNKVTFIVILKMLRDTDDTVLTKKFLLTKLIAEADSLITHSNFQKLIGSLVSSDLKRLLTPDEVESLKLGEEHSTSKKEVEKRVAELMDAENLAKLVGALSHNLEAILSEESYKFVALLANFTIQRSNDDDDDELASGLISKLQGAIEGSKVEWLTDPAGHRFIKELIKLENQRQKPTLSIYIWELIKQDFMRYAKDKSVYVIVSLLENCSVLKKKIVKAAKPHIKSLAKEVTKLEKQGKQQSGAKLLYDLVK